MRHIEKDLRHLGIALAYKPGETIIMKTTIDIPDKTLEDAMRFAHAKTKRQAILTAVEEFNGRHRMAALARHLGTCKDLMTRSELDRMRSEE